MNAMKFATQSFGGSYLTPRVAHGPLSTVDPAPPNRHYAAVVLMN